jgi:hypothetical protein
MKKLLVVFGIVLVLVIVVGAALAGAMTKEYSATFSWGATTADNMLLTLNTLAPNVTYASTNFWDYILQGKGHEGLVYTEGYVDIRVNVTDSSGSFKTGHTIINWDASNLSTYPETITVKVLGLVAGPAKATIDYDFFRFFSEWMNYHVYKTLVMDLEVG